MLISQVAPDSEADRGGLLCVNSRLVLITPLSMSGLLLQDQRCDSQDQRGQCDRRVAESGQKYAEPTRRNCRGAGRQTGA